LLIESHLPGGEQRIAVNNFTLFCGGRTPGFQIINQLCVRFASTRFESALSCASFVTGNATNARASQAIEPVSYHAARTAKQIAFRVPSGFEGNAEIWN
jgi:hypothetical protein